MKHLAILIWALLLCLLAFGTGLAVTLAMGWRPNYAVLAIVSACATALGLREWKWNAQLRADVKRLAHRNRSGTGPRFGRAEADSDASAHDLGDDEQRPAGGPCS